jgi:hypothetical protein
MTDIKELDALAQAISDAETRAGRTITEDEALAVARAFTAIGWTSSFSMKWAKTEIALARAAYAAGRESVHKPEWNDAIEAAAVVVERWNSEAAMAAPGIRALKRGGGDE